ncbi:MAG: sulfatase-like hydrolase/transferase [Granulosicoccus sp.]|nr:sulfatase-like hydrolase/transferase [Granulosicoccus sp.]
MKSTEPNFLIISADQQRADCLGIAGRNIKTPHLDQLARQGTRFDTAITPCVVCQPARASILTGQLCRTHGVHDNGIDLNPTVGEKGFAGTLAKAGYDTSYFGKAHFSTYHTYEKTGTPECLKSSADYPDNWYGPYMGFSHVEIMLVGHNWFLPEKPPRGQHYERWFYADGKGDQRNELYRQNAHDTHDAAQTWHSLLPVEWHNSTWTADRAIDWLSTHNQGKPFCTWISFPDPHHPFDCPVPWSEMHAPEDVDLPPYRSRDFQKRPWWHEAVLTNEPAGKKEHASIRKQYSRISEQTDTQLREIIANTYGQIALIDHQVGRILRTLESTGLADNTIVIYLSDHGDWLGDHGLILKGPMHYEGLLRVPLIMRGPGIESGRIIQEPVSTIDIGPTLFDYAQCNAQLTQHGSSLKPLLEDPDATRSFARAEWELLPTRTGVPLSLQVIRTRTHKLTIDTISEAGELYDLKQDPYEQNNVFDQPDAREIKQQLMSFIQQRPNDRLPIQTQVGLA